MEFEISSLPGKTRTRCEHARQVLSEIGCKCEVRQAYRIPLIKMLGSNNEHADGKSADVQRQKSIE
jgi:hypothetical protein